LHTLALAGTRFIYTLLRIVFFPFLFFLLFFGPGYFHRQQSSSLSLSPSIIMTSSSPTPDISSLSLSSQPPHQRLHDTYDYDGTGTGNIRAPYHFATSPPLPPSQPPFQPLSMNQSPLKTKTARAGLPSVCPLFFSHWISVFNINYPHMHSFCSNGSMVVLPILTIALCLLLIILICLLVEARRLSHTSMLPQVFPLPIKLRTTRLYPRPLSSKTSLLMSNARLFWTSSYVFCYASPRFSLMIPLTGFPVHSNPVCIQLPLGSVWLFQGSRLCQFSAGL
jgi:hypothetical protein